MEPLAGAAPARSSYKKDLQPAAKRQKKWWAATVLPRVLRFKRPQHHSLMLAARKWSQSRVLPSAELAYETCLSAGSIAFSKTGALTRSCTGLKLAYRARASLTIS